MARLDIHALLRHTGEPPGASHGIQDEAKSETPARFMNLARSYVQAGDMDSARIALKRSLDLGTLNDPGYDGDDLSFKEDHYLQLLAMERDLTNALLREGPDPDRLLRLNDMATAFGEHERAQAFLDHAREQADRERRSLLRSVVFFLTYRCNLRCTHCWNYNHMDPELFDLEELPARSLIAVLERSEILRRAHLCFTGGEIFVRKDVEEILHHAAALGIRFNFITNGCYPDRLGGLLSRDVVRRSLSSVFLSLDGPESVHDTIRGKGVYERVMESIRVVCAYGVRCDVSTIIQRDNLDHLEEVSAILNDTGVDAHHFELEMCGKRYRRLKDVRRIKPFLSSDHYLRVLEETRFPGLGCRAGFTKCNIRPDGRVEACATSGLGSPYILGSVKEFDLDFDRLWMHPNAERVRQQVRDCPGCASFCER